MKKVSYIFTRHNTGELMEDSIITPLVNGEHEAQVPAMFFVEDGVYHLAKGSRSSKSLKILMSEKKIKLIGHYKSIRNRNLKNFILDGVQTGELNDFYNLVDGVDHIICL